MLQEGIQVERQGGCPVLFVDVLKWTPSCKEIRLKIHVAIGTQPHRYFDNQDSVNRTDGDVDRKSQTIALQK